MEGPRPDGDTSLLLLDDDAAFRTRLGRALEGRGFTVTSIGSVAEAVERGQDQSARLCGARFAAGRWLGPHRRRSA